jgi:RNA ligase
MNIEKLKRHIANKLVHVQKHPKTNLWIYNYSPKVQYDKSWDDITMMCRGLILDENYNIIARPFRKFFNIEELGSLVNIAIPYDQYKNCITDTIEPFEVYEKMDGSLGILYFLNDLPMIATRGSFTSEQAQKANQILYSKYPHTFPNFEKDKTYLFEIIYPENKICIDYGGLEDLILLAIIDNETGKDLPLVNIGFPIVAKYDGLKSITELKALNWDNKEGFVIKFKSGLRAKVKFSDYLRLHRLVTGVSNITIWEMLVENKSIDDILERVPDEFYHWVKKTTKDLLFEYAIIESQCKSAYKELDTRKDTAIYFQSQKYSSVLFAMLDKKDYSKIIWKHIRPVYCKPFKIEI